MNLSLPVIFIAIVEFFYRYKTAPEELGVLHFLSVDCASLPVSRLSSSISFLCCTGAEHYVNLVIGTGPSPLYGFLLSRSTWLVKEDGMKINEGQQIHQEGVYLSNTSAEEIAKITTVSPWLCHSSTHFVPFYLFFFLPILALLKCELWTLTCKATTLWLDWCRYISLSFPSEVKRSVLQNRFSSTIHAGCRSNGVAGQEPLCSFI